MDTISITSAREFDLSMIARTLRSQFKTTETPDGNLMVDGKSSRVYLHLNIDPEKSERALLLLDYSNVELVKKVITLIADSPDFLVDNDFGTVMPGNLFVERLKTENGWDWRS